MAIRYDHTQIAKNADMVLAGMAANKTYTYPSATYTDQEVYRAYINPGFNGTLEFLEIIMKFDVTGAAANLTGKWQIRDRLRVAWVDIVSIPTTALGAAQAVSVHKIFDTTTNAAAAPWELRLIVSTSAASALTLEFGTAALGSGSGGILSTRTVGESV